MLSLVEKHWRLNRTAVNPDTDRLVEYLRKQLNADVVEADSGEGCLTWRIPQRWQVRTGKSDHGREGRHPTQEFTQ